MKVAVLAGLAALGLACAEAGAAGAADMSSSLPLRLDGSGPYYTLAIDSRARQLSAATDLGDLRVRNAAGETMAFAWVEAPLPVPVPRQAPARLYKVPLAPVAASASDAAADAPRQSWIVETHAGDDDLLRLELALERGTQGVYTLRIEASDDLQHWRTLQEDAQLVQLQAMPQVGATGTLAPLAQREHLDADGIDLDNVHARYLRLTTAPRSSIPPLVSATLVRAPHRAPPAPLEWSEPIAPLGCEASSCDYPLPRNAPVAAVQILPADVDTIAQVMVLGRIDGSRRATPHHSLVHGSLHALRLKARHSTEPAGGAWEGGPAVNVYWLSQAGGAPDLHSPPVHLPAAPWQALRLETFGPLSQLGHTAPTIRVGVRQRQLVFLARGAGPFVLARAPADDRSAPMPLADLTPGRDAEGALPAAFAVIVQAIPPMMAASASHPPSPPSPARPSNAPWLWAVLLAGLALMGAAAWSLLRRQPATAPRDGA
jgi:hypothetical protein